MKQLGGKVAAITGAGSGIGRALAIRAATEHMDVAIADIDEASLAETVGMCEGQGVKVSSRVLDVANRADVHGWAEEVVSAHGKVNLVINNAGVALGATIESMSYEDFEWLMGINFWGVVYGTKAFLPHLIASGEGHIVNVSSVFGLQAIPTQSAYNAAKFAVRGFTDALRIELDIARNGVSATTVHPGGVKTNIARSARRNESTEGISADVGADFERLARTTPEEAAEVILAAVRRNRRRVVIGNDGRVFDFIARLPAAPTQILMARGFRRMKK